MRKCSGCGQPRAWCNCPTVLGFEIRTDDRMGRDQVALVNDDGRGVSVQGGEITDFIMPLHDSEEDDDG